MFTFQVEYFFTSDCEECDIFSIDRDTGEIRLERPLLPNKDRYQLQVNAIDGDSTMRPEERNEAPSTSRDAFLLGRAALAKEVV